MKSKFYESNLLIDIPKNAIKSYLVFYYDPKTCTSFIKIYKNKSSMERALKNYRYCHRTVIPEWRIKNQIEEGIKNDKKEKDKLPF